jgi:replicative DNA helicase
MARSTDISPISQLLTRIDAIADGAAPPGSIASGFPSIDRMLGGGLRRGDLIVLGGDVASGKSALALAIALRAAEQRVPVVYYAGEMTADRVMERALAIEGRVRVDDLRQGSLSDAARAAVGGAAVRLRDRMPAIDRIPPGGWSALSADVGTHAGARLIVVDSLQALATGRQPQSEELADTVLRLKAMALDLNVVVLVTSQVGGLAGREDRRPQLDDFGLLGAVKHHADVIFALYRECMYESRREIEGATELLVRKNRNGATGYVDLYFYAQWMRFEDMLDPDR